MAIPKKTKKDYRICEFCKIQPCMFVAKGEVEYGTHCRNYIGDTRKISNDKMKRKTYVFLPN